MTLYEMTPAQVWAAWKNQALTVNDVLAYQAQKKLYFNPDGTFTTGAHNK